MNLIAYNFHLTIFKKTTTDQGLVVKNGFSLVEILLYLLVILGMATILISASATLSKTRGANYQTLAVKIASQEIEGLHKTTFASLPSSGPITNSDLSQLPSGSATLTVSNYGSPPDPNIKLITVAVIWAENGTTNSVNLDTLITANGY